MNLNPGTITGKRVNPGSTTSSVWSAESTSHMKRSPLIWVRNPSLLVTGPGVGGRGVSVSFEVFGSLFSPWSRRTISLSGVCNCMLPTLSTNCWGTKPSKIRTSSVDKFFYQISLGFGNSGSEVSCTGQSYCAESLTCLMAHASTLESKYCQDPHTEALT